MLLRILFGNSALARSCRSGLPILRHRNSDIELGVPVNWSGSASVVFCAGEIAAAVNSLRVPSASSQRFSTGAKAPHDSLNS